MSERRARPLVVDTSVALKFYLPEAGHEEALRLLEAEESGATQLLAPGTILPRRFNAITWQRRCGLLDAEDAGEAWEKLLRAPIYTYATEDLIERAAEIANEAGAIVYDALFLALAEDARTLMVTADGKLLKTLEGTRHASPASPLERPGNLLLWCQMLQKVALKLMYFGCTPITVARQRGSRRSDNRHRIFYR